MNIEKVGQQISFLRKEKGLTQSELLLPMAEAVLKTLRLSFDDIDLYAATMGPGSFTGVRIGAALVKGLAFGKDIPCVSVSTIESLAYNLMPIGPAIIVPVMDARRSQVYTAIFSSDENTLTRLTDDEAIAISELAEKLKGYSDKEIFLVGDGYDVALRGLSGAGIKISPTPALLRSENAYSVAEIALKKYQSGEYLSDKEISPIYLRVPQAERERLEKIQLSESTK